MYNYVLHSSFLMELCASMRIEVSPGIALTTFYERDIPQLINILNDEAVAENTLKVPQPFEEKDARDWLRFTDKEAAAGRINNFAIRQGELLIGGIGEFPSDAPHFAHTTEIGYQIGKEYRGQGIMTACVSAFVTFLFTRRNYERVTAHVFEENPASSALLEKNGFIREGLLRKCFKKDEHYKNAILYAILREDWEVLFDKL